MSDVARVFREEWGHAVSILIRVLGDFELAEDAVQDAFAIAAERWPRDGTPRNPGAWRSSSPAATRRSPPRPASR